MFTSCMNTLGASELSVFYDPNGHIIEAAEKLNAVIARFMAQGLSPEETADRMGIPLDFVVSSLNGAK